MVLRKLSDRLKKRHSRKLNSQTQSMIKGREMLRLRRIARPYYWKVQGLVKRYPKQTWFVLFSIMTVFAILGPLAAREFKDVFPLPRVFLGWLALVGGIGVPIIGFALLLWEDKS